MRALNAEDFVYELIRGPERLFKISRLPAAERCAAIRALGYTCTARELDDCICSKVFFGVDGIDLEHGITTSTIDEAKLTRRMMRAASQVVVLADSSKFGQRGFGRICALEDIDVIVTDERIPEQMISIIEEAGVDLIIVR